MRQTSRGKFNRLQRATAESTTSTLDEYGLRCHQPARPPPYASYPVLVHRLASLLYPSFKPRLTTSPLRFANPSPPSGRVEDLHLQAVKHARHTENSPGRQSWVMASNPKTVPKGRLKNGHLGAIEFPGEIYRPSSRSALLGVVSYLPAGCGGLQIKFAASSWLPAPWYLATCG